MVAIARDVGNHSTTVDAPDLQPIIREILNFSHPPYPSRLSPLVVIVTFDRDRSTLKQAATRSQLRQAGVSFIDSSPRQLSERITVLTVHTLQLV